MSALSRQLSSTVQGRNHHIVQNPQSQRDISFAKLGQVGWSMAKAHRLQHIDEVFNMCVLKPLEPKSENQRLVFSGESKRRGGGIIALDPGVRTFMTARVTSIIEQRVDSSVLSLDS